MPEDRQPQKTEMTKSRGFLKVRPAPVLKDFKDLQAVSWNHAPKGLPVRQAPAREAPSPVPKPPVDTKVPPEKPSPPRGSRNTEAQDEFFKQMMEEGVTVQFNCFESYQARGRIRGIDTYGVIIETNEGPELIFKHGIISVKPVRKK